MPKGVGYGPKALKGLTKKKKEKKKLQGLQTGGKVNRKETFEQAVGTTGGDPLELARRLNTFREGQARGVDPRIPEDTLGVLSGLDANQLAQLQRFTEATQANRQLRNPQSLDDVLSGIVVPGAALSYDVLKSIPAGIDPATGRTVSLLENFGILHDALTGSTEGRQISTPQPGVTSDDQSGNLAATLQGLVNFQSGGQVPQVQGLRVPTQDVLQQFQTGGLVNKVEQAASGISPNLSGINQVQGQLQGFNPLQSGPLGGQAEGALGNLLGGAPVDVSGIGDVAQNRATTTFGDLTAGINEQAGMLGLGSSSARTAALGREAGRLSGEVANQTLLANIAEQQARSGRQAQGLGLFQGFAGQQLQGLTAAGGLAGQAAGLDLQGQTARAGALGNLANTLLPIQAQQMNRPPQGRSRSGSARSGPARSTGGNGYTRTRSRGGGGISGGSPGRRVFQSFQAGGRVDFGDHLSDYLYGRKFRRDKPAPAPARSPVFVGGGRRGSAPSAYRKVTSQRVDPQQNALRNEQFFAMQKERLGGGTDYAALGDYLNAGGRGVVPIGMSDPRALEAWLKFMGPQRVHEGLMQTGRLVSSGTRTGMNPGSQVGNAALNSPMVQQGLISPESFALRRQTGGVIDGPAVPPDQVPIMAQGGEGVIPVDVMHELENFTGSPEQAMNIVRTIQDVMGFIPGERGPKEENTPDSLKRQTGGYIPTDRQRIGGFQGQGTFPYGATYSQTGSAPPEFSLTGSSGQDFSSSTVAFNGEPMSSDLSSDRLEAARLRRRAALFDSLIGQSRQAAASRLAQRRDHALQQAAQFELMEQAELQRRQQLQQQAIQSAGYVEANRAQAQGRQSPEVTPQQLRQAILDAQDLYLQQSELGTIPDSREEFIDEQLRLQGLGEYSPFAEEAQAARQQRRRFSEFEAQGNEKPMFESPKVQGTLSRAGGEQARRLGPLVEPGPTPIQAFTGNVGPQQTEIEQLMQDLESGLLSPEQAQGAQQLVAFLAQQADAGRGTPEGEQAAQMAQAIAARLAQLGVGF